MPFSLGTAIVSGLSPSVSAFSSLSSVSSPAVSSSLSPSYALQQRRRRIAARASLKDSTSTVALLDRANFLQPRKSLHRGRVTAPIASRLHTVSTASRIFGFGASPQRVINDFHAHNARRRNSASVAPNYQRRVVQPRTSRYVPSASHLVNGSPAPNSRQRDSISLNRAGNNKIKRPYCDANGSADQPRKRSESRLYDEDALVNAIETQCALSAVRGADDDFLHVRDLNHSTGLRRSSSESTNSPSSCTSSASTSSPSCASSRSISSASSTTLALSGAKRAAIDDRNNHPNEKIVRCASCVEQVSSRLAFYRLYELGGLVGQGNFSNVHVVYAESFGVKYAVKEIDKTRMQGKTHFVENEIAILKRCSHRNICRLFEAFQCAEFYFLVFEYAPRGDLFEAIKRMNHLSERAAAQITYQVASALGYLHARRIVHRDVKPENVLLGSQLTAKLTDFGLACTVLGPLYRVCGTPTYVAPEVLTQEGYGFEVDVWSLGVLLYVMLIGFAPFRCADRAQLFRMIVKAKVSFDMPSWSRISLRAKQLIVRMLIPKSMLRLRADEVCSNEWIRVHIDARNDRNEL